MVYRQNMKIVSFCDRAAGFFREELAARKQGASSSRLSGGLFSFRLRRDGGMERVTDVAECCWTQAGERLIKRVIMSANQGECRSRRENKRPSELRAGPWRRTA